MFESSNTAKDSMPFEARRRRPGARGRLCTALVACSILALMLGGAAAAKPTAGAASDRFLLTSHRDGRHHMYGASARAVGTSAGGPRVLFGTSCGGAYSIRPDGSGLTPLVPRSRRLLPRALSSDRRTVAYTDPTFTNKSIYVTRADGSGLRRLVRYDGGELALSHDGRLLAFSGPRGGIWVVRTNGRGLRRVTSRREDGAPNWSPDSQALVFIRNRATKADVMLQPLRGKPRVLARASGSARWSPDGRWIAYIASPDALWVVRPDGAQRHRLAPHGLAFAWAPDSRRLVFDGVRRRLGTRLAIVGVDGRRLRWLKGGLSPELEPSWSPDGRSIAVKGSRSGASEQIWVFRSDGGHLHPLTQACDNELVGWTRGAPVMRPDPPPEHVLGAETVATRDPVSDLSADGSQVAFVVHGSPTHCPQVTVWTPAAKSFSRFRVPSPCLFYSWLYGVELAGTRAAWASIDGCGNSCDVSLESATIAKPAPVDICATCGNFSADGRERWDFHLHGDGELLVFNVVVSERSRLLRIGGGTERCGDNSTARICATLRSDAHAGPVDSVSGGLIAIHEPDAVAVLDAQGALVRVFPFLPDEVRAARLDENRLVVARLEFLDVYNVATGALELSQALPAGFELEEVDGGIAVLRHGETIMLLRLGDGRSRTLTPGSGPRFAELEPSGLYYSYATGDGEGRVVFVQRSQLSPFLERG